MDWKQDILWQIRERDRQVASVARVVQTYSKLGERISRYADRTHALEKKTRQLQQDHEKLLKDIEKGDGISAIPVAQQRISDLEQEIRALKTERSELYRTQGVNAQRLLDISDKMREQEHTINSQNNEQKLTVKYLDRLELRLTELREELRRRTSKVQDQADALREKDNIIQILQDEMNALQLELVQYDKKMEALKEENEQLVQRWMEKMTSEADYMNDVTNELRRARRASLLSPSSGTRVEEGGFFGHPTKSNSYVTWPNHPSSVTAMIDASSSELHSLAISGDGYMLATGGQEKVVSVYDSVTGKSIARFKDSLNSVNCVQFNTDSSMLLAASSDSSIYTWDLNKMRVKNTLTGHIGKVVKATFNKDSTRIVSCSQDRTIKIWNVQKGTFTKTIFAVSGFTDMCLQGGTGTIVASHMNNVVCFWDSHTGNSIHDLRSIHKDTITSISCSEDGRLLLTNSQDRTLKIVDTRTYTPTMTLSAKDYQPPKNWSSALLSPDERYVAAGSLNGNVVFWDLTNGGKMVHSAPVHKLPASGLCWHPTATRFYTADIKGNICVLE